MPAIRQGRVRCLAAIHDGLQRVVASAREVGVQFQIAPTGGVEDHGIVETLVAQAAQVRQGGALCFSGVAQEAASSTNGQGQVLAAETLEVLGRKLLAETFVRGIAFKIPGTSGTVGAFPLANLVANRQESTARPG